MRPWHNARFADDIVKSFYERIPDSKVHGANRGPIWGRQYPGGPHIGPMNLAIWELFSVYLMFYLSLGV